MNTGSNKREIPSIGFAQPVFIAVDWIANNLYIVERAGKRIDMIGIDNGRQRVAISDYLVTPKAIALDPMTG